MTHAPGPWTNKGQSVYGADDSLVAKLAGPEDQVKANGRLIEAAPALYEFVEDFIKECERNGISSHEMPLLRRARFVAAQAGDRTSQPAMRASYARSK